MYSDRLTLLTPARLGTGRIDITDIDEGA